MAKLNVSRIFTGNSRVKNRRKHLPIELRYMANKQLPSSQQSMYMAVILYSARSLPRLRYLIVYHGLYATVIVRMTVVWRRILVEWGSQRDAEDGWSASHSRPRRKTGGASGSNGMRTTAWNCAFSSSGAWSWKTIGSGTPRWEPKREK